MKITISAAEINMITTTSIELASAIAEAVGKKYEGKPAKIEDLINKLQDSFNPEAIAFNMVDDNTLVIDLQIVPGLCTLLKVYVEVCVDIALAVHSIWPLIKRGVKRYENAVANFATFIAKK